MDQDRIDLIIKFVTPLLLALLAFASTLLWTSVSRQESTMQSISQIHPITLERLNALQEGQQEMQIRIRDIEREIKRLAQ